MSLYVLQIGINKYHPSSGVSSLSGCVEDVVQLRQWLRETFLTIDLQIKTLLDEEATYQNVIKHFGESHLVSAKVGDAVLIQFSGHGARERAAPEFAAYFPDEKQETFICYDSRMKGRYDLADKELAVLVERIAQQGAHVAVIMDCCHAGSGTKSGREELLGEARQWDDRETIRPLESYLDGHFMDHVYVPNSRHILLAACEKREKAYELNTGQGNFTAHLVTVLRKYNGKLSYHQLFDETRVLMRKITSRQTPQFEPSGYFNPYDSFLGMEGNSKTSFHTMSFRNEFWEVGVGAIQGLPSSTNKPAVFEIYENEKLIGHGKSLAVHLNSCQIEVEAELDHGLNYQAKLISLPISKIAVELNRRFDDLPLVDMSRLSRREAKEDFQAIYFELLEEVPDALYQLVSSEGQLLVIRRVDQLIIRRINGVGEWAFRNGLECLEHLCRWETTLALDNAQTGVNEDVSLLLEIVDENRQVLETSSAAEVLVEILRENGTEKKVHFRLKVVNDSYRDWHCSLLYFSGNYGVHAVYNELVPKRSAAIVMERNSRGEAYAFALNGKVESMDIFKLIVSQGKVDDYLLTQKGIQLGETVSPKRGSFSRANLKIQENWRKWFVRTMRCRSIENYSI